MALPWGVPHGTVGGPTGYTYGALAVRAPDERERFLSALRRLRFSGWVAPDDDWAVAVPARAGAAVAGKRRGLLEVGAELAHQIDAPVVGVRVLADRQLVLVVWRDGDEIGRYVSDPSHGLDDETILPMPMGSENAAAFAAALGVPEAADELEELLGEELDADSVIESERLAGVLRLLALPGWLVSAASLPRDVPLGPRAREFTRLGAGVPGVRGRLLGRAVDVVRKRRRPPPVVADPPRADFFF